MIKMSIFYWILAATTVDGLAALVGVATLWFQEKTFRKIITLLVAFSAGTLFAGALFHLIAEAIEGIGVNLSFLLVTLGFSIFFLLERYLWWHHCHEGECDVHPVSYLVLIGDSVHNVIDGTVIAASFLVSIKFGILTTGLILLHELPQELGDFAILVHGGFSKHKALLFNLFSQITCVLGGLLSYFVFKVVDFVPFVLPFAAGGFLYISASDLVPELHRQSERFKSFMSFMLFIFGVGLMIFVKTLG